MTKIECREKLITSVKTQEYLMSKTGVDLIDPFGLGAIYVRSEERVVQRKQNLTSPTTLREPKDKEILQT
jgi:hypothetical protein